MSAPVGLRGCLPASLRVERLLLLVTYLDDSGKDPQNLITSLGGYAAPEDAWAIFERDAEPIFQKYIGDESLHAKDLYHGEGIYEDWKVLQKQSFVAQLCMKLYPLQPLMGVSFSVQKAGYATRAAEAIKRRLRKRTVTPYTFCMTAILNWVLTDVQVGKVANEIGLALILECGNEHNEEAKQSLDAIKERHNLEHVRSLSFVPKTECRAIQMADLFAYYTRRHSRNIQVAGKEPPTDPVLKVLLEDLRHRTYVATDFGPEMKASRFFAGDLG